MLCQSVTVFLQPSEKGKILFSKEISGGCSLYYPCVYVDPSATQANVAEAGDKFIASLYQPKDKDATLDEVRNLVRITDKHLHWVAMNICIHVHMCTETFKIVHNGHQV